MSSLVVWWGAIHTYIHIWGVRRNQNYSTMWSKEKKIIHQDIWLDMGPHIKNKWRIVSFLCVHIVSFLLLLVFNEPLVIGYHWVDKFGMTKSKCAFVKHVLTWLFIYIMVMGKIMELEIITQWLSKRLVEEEEEFIYIKLITWHPCSQWFPTSCTKVIMVAPISMRSLTKDIVLSIALCVAH